MKFILLTLISFSIIHPLRAANEELIGLNSNLLSPQLNSIEYAKIENQIEALIKDYQKFLFLEEKLQKSSEEEAPLLFTELSKLAFDILSNKIYLMNTHDDEARLNKVLILTKMSDIERIELAKKEILLNK